MAATEQLLIVYEDANDHCIRKYSAAYDDDMAREYLVACVKRHGRSCNARVVKADKVQF
jgi:hypothetical protein